MSKAPVVMLHDGIHVVRDDLYPGGTKARYLGRLFDTSDEVVYASPPQGGAQTALAYVAADLGKRATIFIAKRAIPHPRSLMAKRLGAKVLQVRPGYLNVVQARARAYCVATGAALAPFGMNVPGAAEAIAEAGRSTGLIPDEVWCASGSGVLARGLALAFPMAARHSVEVGRTLAPTDVAGARIHHYHKPFDAEALHRPPFPSDLHYDAKAWEVCKARHGRGIILMWNVTGQPQG